MLMQLGQYLFYLRPGELVPAYATAWLLLALPLLGIYLLVGLLLRTIERYSWLRLLREALVTALIAAAAAGIAATFFFATLEWVRTYGWLLGTSLGSRLTVVAAGLGALAALTRRGKRFMQSLTVFAGWGTACGALTLVSLPFFAWSTPSARAADSPAAAQLQRPHIVILTLDALSAERMSLYGAERPTTPRLEDFARTAMTFERAYANANFTTPGLCSVLTGTRPWIHRAFALPSWPRPELRAVSVPALLQASGYQTGYVSTNAEGGATKLGMGRYFDFASRDHTRGVGPCSDALSQWLRYACPASELPPFKAFAKLELAIEDHRGNAMYDPTLALDPALAWLRSVDKSRPVFLWVHLFPPHSPYAVPAPWLGRFDASPDARTLSDSEPNWAYRMARLPQARIRTLAARYDESIAYVDHFAGQFLSAAAQILGDDTVFIVSSDHGESFSHGYGAHQGPALYDSLIHIPLIIRLPHQRQGSRSPMLAEQVDLAPTIAALAGIQPPRVWEGHSLLGAWRDSAPSSAAGSPGPAAETDGPVFSMDFEENSSYGRLRTGSIAIIEGQWKLIRYIGTLHYPLMPRLSDELYDLASDPTESHNRIAEQPQQARSLEQILTRELARVSAPVN
jgi:arylsulfatase A-like enzyme